MLIRQGLALSCSAGLHQASEIRGKGTGMFGSFDADTVEFSLSCSAGRHLATEKIFSGLMVSYCSGQLRFLLSVWMLYWGSIFFSIFLLADDCKSCILIDCSVKGKGIEDFT